MRDRKHKEIKYKFAWMIGTLVSFFIYFSGLCHLYIFLRKNIFKRYIVLVLTYHRIHDGNEDNHISVRLEKFKHQMDYLKENFIVVSLDGIINFLENAHCLKNDVVAITFDDGWKDNYSNAFQVLIDCGFPAAIFVATSYIGKDYGLTKAEIKIMDNNNITFGAHTISHNSLSEVDYKTALIEIKGSKLELEKILQKKIKYFAYPFGKKGQDFSIETIEKVKETGFIAAFSTNNGRISDKSNIFALERIGIRNVPLFVFKVRVSGIFENKWINILRKYLGRLLDVGIKESQM